MLSAQEMKTQQRAGATSSAAGRARKLAEQVDEKRIVAIRSRLLRWFRKHQRDLPWRRKLNPYAVWVSEVMLQQTQVAKVVDCFDRFLSRFPTVEDLAAASLQEVLRVWEGLGYYRRAIHLWQAAQIIRNQFGGQIPQELDRLQALPGVGRYTAGAILSIGFGKPAPILEANSRRVLSRMFAQLVSSDRSQESQLWDLAGRLVCPRHPGDFNQALMELGSLVCLPARPRCGLCPVRGLCDFAGGRCPPLPTSCKSRPIEHQSVVVLAATCDGKVLLGRHGPGERWALLWDFPRFELEGPCDPVAEAERKITGLFPCDIATGQKLGVVKHAVTRFRIRAEVVLIGIRPQHKKGRLACNLSQTSGRCVHRACPQRKKASAGRKELSQHGHPSQPPGEWAPFRGTLRWVAISDLESLPMPAASRRIATMLISHLKARSTAGGEDSRP